jgi:hypothetical protein
LQERNIGPETTADRHNSRHFAKLAIESLGTTNRFVCLRVALVGHHCGGQMDKIPIALACVALAFVFEANAQSVPKVTGAVGGVAGSVAGGAPSGGLSMTSPSAVGTPGNPLGTGMGGDLPGALKFKAGDRTLQLRGSAGVGDDRGNIKAGLGIPF